MIITTTRFRVATRTDHDWAGPVVLQNRMPAPGVCRWPSGRSVRQWQAQDSICSTTPILVRPSNRSPAAATARITVSAVKASTPASPTRLSAPCPQRDAIPASRAPRHQAYVVAGD